MPEYAFQNVLVWKGVYQKKLPIIIVGFRLSFISLWNFLAFSLKTLFYLSNCFLFSSLHNLAVFWPAFVVSRYHHHHLLTSAFWQTWNIALNFGLKLARKNHIFWPEIGWGQGGPWVRAGGPLGEGFKECTTHPHPPTFSRINLNKFSSFPLFNSWDVDYLLLLMD